jgi:hypothetical protein
VRAAAGAAVRPLLPPLLTLTSPATTITTTSPPWLRCCSQAAVECGSAPGQPLPAELRGGEDDPPLQVCGCWCMCTLCCSWGSCHAPALPCPALPCPALPAAAPPAWSLTGLEFCTRCRHTPASPHHADRGFNAIQFSHVANCWVRQVRAGAPFWRRAKGRAGQGRAGALNQSVKPVAQFGNPSMCASLANHLLPRCPRLPLQVRILNSDNGIFFSWVDRSAIAGGLGVWCSATQHGS